MESLGSVCPLKQHAAASSKEIGAMFGGMRGHVR